MRLGHTDRQLTMLTNTRRLNRLPGSRSASTPTPPPVKETTGDRTVLGVPVLGSLPIGHGPNPLAVPVGTPAVLDTTAGTLTVAPAVW